jgi:hypothetical protein
MKVVLAIGSKLIQSKISWLILALIFLTPGCKNKKNEWILQKLDHSRSLLVTSSTWEEPIRLKVLNHSVKFIEWKDSTEWAFRVKLIYPRNNYDDSVLVANTLKIGIPKSFRMISLVIKSLKYEIYDTDEFLIDTIQLEPFSIYYGDTLKIQAKKRISKEFLNRFNYGRISIEAGPIEIN